MSKHIYVRPARQEDAENVVNWSVANRDRNLFDPAVVHYPSTFTLCAFDANGPVAYMPVQQPLMLEAVAPCPGASRLEVAVAMREMLHTAVTQAYVNGAREIYFLTDDAETQRFAGQAFERLPYAVYRLRLSDLKGS